MTLAYLGDDLLMLAEVDALAADLDAPLLYRASERSERWRLERWGTDRAGYPGDKPWRGGRGLLHEDVILATTADDLRRGAREPDYSTSFKKLPIIDDPLLLLYDARAFERLGPKEYAFRPEVDRPASLLRMIDVEVHPMPQGWISTEEGLAYRALVQRAGPRVVEVGCWRGKSASYVARVCGLTCVDHFAGSSDQYDAAYRETLATEDIRAAFEAHAEILGGVRLLPIPSLEAASQFSEGSLDLVFLDASHDEAAVRDDIAAWRPKLRSGGILAGHDHDDEHPGVITATHALQPNLGPGSIWWSELR